ncbi:unnamed protein product [Tuber aestivum]|uniref:rRNA-processing protein EFG1 n=1 Tax=Tuber aestivum TaxID=59557 RepID=A0A292PI84_9PEZI|nr:unnamed protein product [Tuber aestivum]
MPPENHRHQKRRRRPLINPTGPKTSTTHLKKKVRDLQRLLNNPSSSLPADVRLENERALSAFQSELSAVRSAAKVRSIAKRYHMVRFFERQKATRKLRKAERELEKVGCGVGKAEVEKKVYEARLDLNYIMHYPPGEKYISLFKDAGVMRERREGIRREIERQMARGGLGESTMGFDDEGEDQEEGGVEPGSGGEGEVVGGEEKRDERAEKRDKKGKSKKAPREEKKLEELDDFFEF